MHFNSCSNLCIYCTVKQCVQRVLLIKSLISLSLSLSQFQCLYPTMAESISEVASPIFQAGFKWGEMSFNISASSVEVVKEICGTAVKISAVGTIGAIGAIYGYPLLKPLINAAVAKAFGGDERDDQEVREIRSGSLHVLLRCFTEARFLEVLEDYESGKIKQRLEKEFLKVGIKNHRVGDRD